MLIVDLWWLRRSRPSEVCSEALLLGLVMEMHYMDISWKCRSWMLGHLLAADSSTSSQFNLNSLLRSSATTHCAVAFPTELGTASVRTTARSSQSIFLARAPSREVMVSISISQCRFIPRFIVPSFFAPMKQGIL